MGNAIGGGGGGNRSGDGAASADDGRIFLGDGDDTCTMNRTRACMRIGNIQDSSATSLTNSSCDVLACDCTPLYRCEYLVVSSWEAPEVFPFLVF